MVKKVSLNISEKTYKTLAELSDSYEQDIEKTINNILDAISFSRGVERLSEDYKGRVELAAVILDLLEMGDSAYRYLFGKILERLGVKGLFRLVDLDINLEDNYMWFSYSAMQGCNLYIDVLDITVSPPELTATYFIETKEVRGEALKKLKEIVENIEELELPEDFYDVDYSIYLDDEDEEFWSLIVACSDDDFNYLPDLNIISDFIKNILKKAGILY